MRWWLTIVTLSSVACARGGPNCGGKALLLWPNAGGGYAPTVVDAPAIGRSVRLTGPAARVYFQAHVGAHGYDGPAAEPRFTNAGGVCVPTDAGSAVATSAFLQFERLRNFDQELGIAEQVSWPRQVGVEIRLNAGSIESVNNAHYAGEKDLTILVPTTVQGVPAAMNHGIVAHEHAHAHVQSQVVGRLMVPPPTVSTEAPAWIFPFATGLTSDRVNRLANDFILRGWNEGLADLYAAIFLNRPEFLRETFGGDAIVQARALDGQALYLSNAVVPQLVDRLERSGGTERERAREELGRNAYGQGSALARALWTVIQADEPGRARTKLSLMMKALPRLPARVSAKLISEPLDYGVILGTLLEDVPVGISGCAHLRRVIAPGDQSFERISACAGY